MAAKPARVNLIGLFDQKVAQAHYFPASDCEIRAQPDAPLTFNDTSALKLSSFHRKSMPVLLRRERDQGRCSTTPARTRKLFQEKHETADGWTVMSRIRRCCWGNPCADHALHTSPSVTRYYSQLKHWIMSRQHKPCESARITHIDHRGFALKRRNSIESKKIFGSGSAEFKNLAVVLMDEKNKSSHIMFPSLALWLREA